MKGLSEEERSALLDPPESGPMTLECWERLSARGLILSGGCVDCGALDDCDCDTDLCVTVVTANGLLALRLDAAARALTGVSA